MMHNLRWANDPAYWIQSGIVAFTGAALYFIFLRRRPLAP